jgi:hypothetical protein
MATEVGVGTPRVFVAFSLGLLISLLRTRFGPPDQRLWPAWRAANVARAISPLA